MKKKLLIFLSLLMLSISLVGCGKDSYNDHPDFVSEMYIADRTFKVIPGYEGDFGDYKILVDKETRVQYLYHSTSYQGGLVVLVDADGKPILYEGELK